MISANAPSQSAGIGNPAEIAAAKSAVDVLAITRRASRRGMGPSPSRARRARLPRRMLPRRPPVGQPQQPSRPDGTQQHRRQQLTPRPPAPLASEPCVLGRRQRRGRTRWATPPALASTSRSWLLSPEQLPSARLARARCRGPPAGCRLPHGPAKPAGPSQSSGCLADPTSRPKAAAAAKGGRQVAWTGRVAARSRRKNRRTEALVQKGVRGAKFVMGPRGKYVV